MKRAWALWIAWLALSIGAFAGQQEAEYERIDVRVISVEADGRVRIDHGQTDGLVVGLTVLLFPRAGGTYGGSIVEVFGRSSLVELFESEAELPPGTKGQALVPRAPSAPTADSAPGAEGEAEGESLGDLPWKNLDEDWRPSMPLLGRTPAVRPEERHSRLYGRLYLYVDGTYTSYLDRSDSFVRFGQDLTWENPFGNGGGLKVDLEQNMRALDLGDDEGEDSRQELRIDRLSYYMGGTRFDPTRLEGGRFLLHGMPEFGVIDGVEVGHRFENGDTVGGSVGYQPEPLDNFRTGEDLQFSGWYRWVGDEDQLFSLTGGFQKTLHNGDPDRELLIAKAQYLPLDAWTFDGTVWIDRYGTHDDGRGPGFELTQAIVSTSRRWKSGNGMHVSYSRRTFPETLRDEFAPVADSQLLDSRSDRLAVRAWRWVASDKKLHGVVGGWDDHVDSGGDGELGLEFRDYLFSGGRVDVTGFATEGRFESVVGGRLTVGRDWDGGSWNVLYEAMKGDVQGALLSSEDDLFQHRLRGSRDVYLDSGWIFSGYAEGILWDEEDAWSLGVQVQRSF